MPACQGLPFGGRGRKTCPVRPCRCCAGSKGPAAHLGKVLGGRLPIGGPRTGHWLDSGVTGGPCCLGGCRQALVDHYSKLSAEAARREQRALWKVRRHRLASARLRFLLEDEKRIQVLPLVTQELFSGLSGTQEP